MISKEEVIRIAKLARLELTEPEAEKMQKDLSSILDYFNLLKNIDTSAAPPLLEYSAWESVTREDIAQAGPASLANNLVEAAPDKKDGYVKVKAILGEKSR